MVWIDHFHLFTQDNRFKYISNWGFIYRARVLSIRRGKSRRLGIGTNRSAVRHPVPSSIWGLRSGNGQITTVASFLLDRDR